MTVGKLIVFFAEHGDRRTALGLAVRYRASLAATLDLLEVCSRQHQSHTSQSTDASANQWFSMIGLDGSANLYNAAGGQAPQAQAFDECLRQTQRQQQAAQAARQRTLNEILRDMQQRGQD